MLCMYIILNLNLRHVTLLSISYLPMCQWLLRFNSIKTLYFYFKLYSLLMLCITNSPYYYIIVSSSLLCIRTDDFLNLDSLAGKISNFASLHDLTFCQISHLSTSMHLFVLEHYYLFTFSNFLYMTQVFTIFLNQATWHVCSML